MLRLMILFALLLAMAAPVAAQEATDDARAATGGGVSDPRRGSGRAQPAEAAHAPNPSPEPAGDGFFVTSSRTANRHEEE